ncbi:putative cytochrome c oxidase subunit 6b-like [Capsicum annuum]|nr:putative cytochrome c oxidase subunit 6b-like [Capsicum annuum]
MLSNKEFDPFAIDCLKDCLELYADAIAMLVDAFTAFLSEHFDIATVLMRTVMDATTCGEGFTEKKGELTLLAKENYNLFQLSDISSSIIKQVSSVPSQPPNKLLAVKECDYQYMQPTADCHDLSRHELVEPLIKQDARGSGGSGTARKEKGEGGAVRDRSSCGGCGRMAGKGNGKGKSEGSTVVMAVVAGTMLLCHTALYTLTIPSRDQAATEKGVLTQKLLHPSW